MISTIFSLVQQTPVYPFLWIPHCIMMNLALRATLGHGLAARNFARQNPLSCYIMSILYIFPGGLLSLLLLNQPLLTILTWSNQLYSATVIWYLMFFGPGDFLYKILTTVPLVTLLFAAAQDWQRVGLVVSGVTTILDSNPGTFLYPVVFATLKSSGFMFVKYVEQLAEHGVDKVAFVLPHHSTKTMVVSAALLTSHQLDILPGLSETMEFRDLHTYLVLIAVSLRILTTLVFKNWDPYSSLESQTCSLLYGRPECEKTEDTKEEAKKDK